LALKGGSMALFVPSLTAIIRIETYQTAPGIKHTIVPIAARNAVIVAPDGANSLGKCGSAAGEKVAAGTERVPA